MENRLALIRNNEPFKQILVSIGSLSGQVRLPESPDLARRSWTPNGSE
jgi:hypothetical protein